MATKVEYEFDPFDVAGIDTTGMSNAEIKDALQEVENFIKESVLSDVGAQRSPVTGGKFKALSKAYKKQKIAEGGKGVPNLELSGAMLSGLETFRKGDKIVLTVSDDEQAKADGHNNFSGDSKLPERKFIPNADAGETFRPAIVKGIKNLLEKSTTQRDESIKVDLNALFDQGFSIRTRGSGDAQG